jgi:hypothetical protein
MDALLVAVDAQEGGVLASNLGVALVPRIVAASRLFDLYHLGTLVPKQHGAVRTGQGAGDVHDVDAGKG